MNIYENEEYFLFKELSNQVINGCALSLDKIVKQCDILINEIEIIDKKLADAESGAKINIYSKSSFEKRNELIHLLAVKNRIEMLIKRNEERVKFINKYLQNEGIYKEVVDKKKLNEIEKQNIDFVSAENLNLNLKDSENNSMLCEFFDGNIFKIVNEKIDFSDEKNQELFKSLNDDWILKILRFYPECFSEIPVQMFMNTSFKKRALKALTIYVVDETKKKSINEVNKNLGELLEFKTEITATAEDYIAGVLNMINVEIKQFLLENSEIEQQSQIKDKLKCNEKSELIPQSKRIAVLSGGVAGKIDSEKDESEELRINREKEMQKQVAQNMNEDNNKANYQNQEVSDVIDELEKEIKKNQEESQLNRQRQIQEEIEKEQMQEEIEKEQMLQSLSKNKYD